MDINLSYLEDITGSDKEMMLEMLTLFIEDIPAQIKQIKKAGEDKNMDTLAREAHKLKPTLQYVGLNEMYELVKNLEAIGKSGEYSESVMTYVSGLESKMGQAIPQLKQAAEKFK